MSKALTQNATELAPSLHGEEDYDFNASVKRQATKTAKGTTRERLTLNRNKLISHVCGEFRMNFASIYGKSEKLPRDIFDKVEIAVDNYLTEQLKQVNSLNVISSRRAFYHVARQVEIVERVTIIGENKLVLQEQLLGVDLMINAAEKRLRDLYAKNTPNFDREKSVQAQIMQLNLTKQYILGEIGQQEKLKKEASATQTSAS